MLYRMIEDKRWLKFVKINLDSLLSEALNFTFAKASKRAIVSKVMLQPFAGENFLYWSVPRVLAHFQIYRIDKERFASLGRC